MLTKKQSEVLRWIDTYTRRHGYGPSYREIAEGCGYRSMNSVWRKIRELEARGWITQYKGCPRAIEVLRLPDREAP